MDDLDKLEVVDIKDWENEELPEEFVGGNKVPTTADTKEKKDE